jgi:hypothetical protein
MLAMSVEEAFELLCQDTLDSSVEEVLRRDDDGQITVAMQSLLRGVAALEAVREAAEEYLNDLDVEGVSTTAYLAAAVAAANPEATDE